MERPDSKIPVSEDTKVQLRPHEQILLDILEKVEAEFAEKNEQSNEVMF